MPYARATIDTDSVPRGNAHGCRRRLGNFLPAGPIRSEAAFRYGDRLMRLARCRVLVALAVSACHSDSVPAPAPLERSDASEARSFDAGPPVLAPAMTPIEAGVPWSAPHLALKNTQTEGPKGPRPALAIEAGGLPALSLDGKTFVFLEEQDYYGHTRDTSIGLLDAETLRTKRLLLARGSENIGDTEVGRFAPKSQKLLQARLDKVLAELAKITWAEVPLPDGHFTAPAHLDAGSEWELVGTTPQVEVSARWTARGEIDSVRVQPGGEVTPTWSPAPVPQCGYPPAPKHSPDQLLSVALVTDTSIVLERAWRMGTHDCDGVPATSQFAFVKR